MDEIPTHDLVTGFEMYYYLSYDEAETDRLAHFYNTLRNGCPVNRPLGHLPTIYYELVKVRKLQFLTAVNQPVTI